ncbi:MAG: hypothetical protein ACJ75H_07465 [Thermoanaerobaculia bacterium]
MIRALPPLSLLALLLASCGGDAPHLSDAGPRPAEIPRQEAAAQGATLAVSGRQSYQGSPSFRCVLHEEDGLQVNFRSGDPELPAVAVRIEEYHGAGPYHALLFVTGRSRTGALVTSTGEANLDVRQRDLPDSGAVALLSGSFRGSYDGGAGKGSIEGRFGGCSYSAFRGGSPPMAGGPAASILESGEDQLAGASEENTP